MNTIDQIKHKLRTDPDGTIMWMAGGLRPRGACDTEEIVGFQIRVMLEGDDNVYVIVIMPGDDGMYDAWLRRMGSTAMVHMLSRRARDPEDVAVLAKQYLLEYIGMV